MNDPIQITDNMEVRMLSVHADWLQAEYKRIDQLVRWHENELLLTSLILCGILVVQVGLVVELARLRKAVRTCQTP